MGKEEEVGLGFSTCAALSWAASTNMGLFRLMPLGTDLGGPIGAAATLPG